MKTQWLNRILLLILLLWVGGFTVYSYSQIDLNLTLTGWLPYQILQQLLIRLGYYHRSWSATLFLIFVGGLFGLYLTILDRIRHKQLGRSFLWRLIFITLILGFAYPAFSHDIFNYMFDARILTKYGLSPYFFKALDFPADPWVRFMHWTHRYYPYGPGWLILTWLPSVLGWGKFTLTLVLFKMMFVGFHLLNCVLVQKISQKATSTNIEWNLAYFGLNPLILIESLMSPHNETAMITLVLLALYLVCRKYEVWGLVAIIASASVKFVSISLLPLLYFWRNHNPQKLLLISCYIWLAGLIPFILNREPYSWYFLPLIALAALLNRGNFFQILMLGISAGTLIRYWPYILFGEYTLQTFKYQTWGALIALLLLMFAGGFFIKKQYIS